MDRPQGQRSGPSALRTSFSGSTSPASLFRLRGRLEKGICGGPASCGRVGGETVVDEVTTPIGFDEAGVFEYAEVLGNGACGDVEEVGQRAHAERAVRKELNDLAALVDREGAEDSGHVLLVSVGHLVQYPLKC